MRTQIIARRITRSLQAVGIAAAVAAGVAGFAPVGGAPSDVVVVEAAKGGSLPQHVCDKHLDGPVSAGARPFLRCLVIEDGSPIEGAPLFS